MTKLVQVPEVKPYKPRPENYWLHALTGFEIWVEKNYQFIKKQQYENRQQYLQEQRGIPTSSK